MAVMSVWSMCLHYLFCRQLLARDTEETGNWRGSTWFSHFKGKDTILSSGNLPAIGYQVPTESFDRIFHKMDEASKSTRTCCCMPSFMGWGNQQLHLKWCLECRKQYAEQFKVLTVYYSTLNLSRKKLAISIVQTKEA